MDTGRLTRSPLVVMADICQAAEIYPFRIKSIAANLIEIRPLVLNLNCVIFIRMPLTNPVTKI